MSEYLALPDGAGRFPQDFSGPVVLRVSAGPFVFRLQGFHLLWRCFPGQLRLRLVVPYADPTTPKRPKPLRFGLFPFRSPLLRESLLFSLPPGT